MIQAVADPELEEDVLLLSVNCDKKDLGCAWTGHLKQWLVSIVKKAEAAECRFSGR